MGWGHNQVAEIVRQLGWMRRVSMQVVCHIVHTRQYSRQLVVQFYVDDGSM